MRFHPDRVCLCALLFLLLGFRLLAQDRMTPTVERGASLYPQKPQDPAAVSLDDPAFGAVGNGVADDTAALQAAIDRVQETTVRGVVLIPAGTYRVSRTLHVWSGIRLLGYGATRPILKLGRNTPGFASGEGNYLVHFTAARPSPGEPVRDANPGTFYSAMANIDIEIEEGNTAAIGVRFHVAQHGFLAHMDFRIGTGRAGVEEIGNELHDCRFFGGDYGIMTTKPSPSWPFVLMDSAFFGQRVAAIRTEEAGMTIVRGHFADVPTAVSVNPERAEALFIEDSRFERISGPALVISEEDSARMQANLLEVHCEQVPVLERFRQSGRTIAGPAPSYCVRTFTHGQHLRRLGGTPRIATEHVMEPLPALPAKSPSRPEPVLPPMTEWTSVKTLGAEGDGRTDDTAALQAAIASHRVLFFPAGFYLVSDTLRLRPDTVLIGLNPITTQLVLADQAPAFLGAQAQPEPGTGPRASGFPPDQGTGTPKPLLETPSGGSNLVSGLGLDTGQNHRAVAVKWRAGEYSLLDDVRFLGGHGTYRQDGSAVPVYNNNRTGDPDARRRWDSQYWSLWVTQGGGGTFRNLWTPNTFARAGMYVSDTSTPGRVYALSSEHHLLTEMRLRRVENWRFYALQFEEERGEGPETVPLLIEDCRTLFFANTYLYRVMSTYAPAAHAMVVAGSTDLRFRGVHLYGPSKYNFDNTLYAADRDVVVRARELALLDVSSDQVEARRGGPDFLGGAQPERIASGFSNADHLVAAPGGGVYFLDARHQTIHAWTPGKGVRLVRDHPLEPVALAVDTKGNLVVATRLGTVLTFDPREPGEAFDVLAPADSAPSARQWILPTSRWRDEHDFLDRATAPVERVHLSLDGTTALAADRAFEAATSASSYFSTIDLIRSYNLGLAVPGQPFYVADEFAQKTYRFSVRADGALGTPHLFAPEGEAAVVTDRAGRVYLAAGDIFVYAADGRELGRITVPERPTSLAVADDGAALYIGARSSVYRLALPGK